MDSTNKFPYKSIFLNGFRATGKTTIGKILAKKLKWDFVDMDELIEQKADMTINELTKGGTAWQEFRQLERDTLNELLGLEKIVVGVGGGAPVNNIVKEGTKKTFGELNAELFRKNPQALIILLTAEDKVIHDRLYNDEMEKPDIKRPILNPVRALLVQKKLLEHMDNPVKQKEIIVEEIIKDSLKMFEVRKPLYAALTDKIIDTGKATPEENAKTIMKLIQIHFGDA